MKETEGLCRQAASCLHHRAMTHDKLRSFTDFYVTEIVTPRTAETSQALLASRHVETRSLGFKEPEELARKSNRRRDPTHPVSPIACILAISLTSKVLHLPVLRSCSQFLTIPLFANSSDLVLSPTAFEVLNEIRRRMGSQLPNRLFHFAVMAAK